MVYYGQNSGELFIELKLVILKLDLKPTAYFNLLNSKIQIILEISTSVIKILNVIYTVTAQAAGIAFSVISPREFEYWQK